ncbi:hypothetical protein P7C70_g6099, partial [Phenoliferia sp. Uapishka_3]
MSEATFPPLTRADVLACRFSSWYPAFRKHSPKASIIKPLEDRFIDYLESDRVFIPEGSGPMGVSELSDDEDEDSRNGSDCSEDQTWQIKFEDLDAKIRTIITKYDGVVFPKLNWSSPQDAAWMMPGSTLKCQSPADVYLLLKSSDFISHDLDHGFDSCVDYEPLSSASTSTEDDLVRSTNRLVVDDDESDATSEEDEDTGPTERSQPRPYDFELVLKKWFEMPRSQEWRCFVREGKLIAISHRDSNYYDFLQESQEEIRAKVVAFFEDEVLNVFPLSSCSPLFLQRAFPHHLPASSLQTPSTSTLQDPTSEYSLSTLIRTHRKPTPSSSPGISSIPFNSIPTMWKIPDDSR